MICPAEPLVPFPPSGSEEKEPPHAGPPEKKEPPRGSTSGGGGGGGSGGGGKPRGRDPSGKREPATPADVISTLGLAALLSGLALGAALGIEAASLNGVAFDPRSLLFATAAGAVFCSAALLLFSFPLVAALATLARLRALPASGATLRAAGLSAGSFAILVQVVLFSEPAPDGQGHGPREFGATDAVFVGLFLLFAALLAVSLFLYARAHFDSSRPRRRAAPRFVALGATLTLFLVLAVNAVSPEPPPTRSQIAPAGPAARADGPRIVVVGIDGLTPERLEDAIRAGAVPTLERHRTIGHLAGCAPPHAGSRTASWVSLLTGARPEAHGVVADSYCRVSGMARPVPFPPRLPAGIPSADLVSALAKAGIARRVPATADLRAERTVFEMLRAHGVPTVEVAFPAADAERAPAPEGSAVVTDEAVAPLRRHMRTRAGGMKGGRTALEIASPREARALVAPAAVEPLVEEATRRGEGLVGSTLAAFASLERSPPMLGRDDPLDALLALASADAVAASIGESLAAALSPRVLAVRLPAFGAVADALEAIGVDVRLNSPESSAALAALRCADGLVARIEAAAGPGAIVVLVSESGGSAARPGRSPRAAGSAGALFLASGPGVRPGGGPGLSAETVDVAPTLLYLAGARPEAGRAGRVLAEAIADETLRDRPIVPLPPPGDRP